MVGVQSALRLSPISSGARSNLIRTNRSNRILKASLRWSAVFNRFSLGRASRILSGCSVLGRFTQQPRKRLLKLRANADSRAPLDQFNRVNPIRLEQSGELSLADRPFAAEVRTTPRSGSAVKAAQTSADVISSRSRNNCSITANALMLCRSARRRFARTAQARQHAHAWANRRQQDRRSRAGSASSCGCDY